MGREDHKAVRRIAVLCLLFAACKKDKPDTTISKPASGNGVYIVCEGSYGSGNASLGLYNPGTDSVYTDVYKAANNQPLGDVFQSMQLINDKFFLCINNSNKVLVIDRNTWLQAGTTGVKQPRYIMPVNDSTAYVSSLFNNKVYVFNPKTFQLTDSINLGKKNTEGMLLYNNKAFICAWDTTNTNLYVVNTTTHAVSDSVNIGHFAPQEVLMDKEQKLWVMSGNAPYGYTAALTHIDPATLQVLNSYTFSAGANPVRPVFNNAKDTLYFIEANYSGGTTNNGVYRMSINAVDLPQVPFVAAIQYQYFWALGIEPGTGNIYIGDPKGFIQKGAVYIYSSDGTLKKQFNVGVGPGHFFFDE